MRLARKLSLPLAKAALPGRAEVMRVPQTHFVNGQPLQRPFPLQHPLAASAGRFWHGLFLERRAQVLADRQRIQHGGGICRRHHTRSQLRGSVFRCNVRVYACGRGGGLVQRRLRCAATLAAMQCNEAALPHIELFLRRDPPFMEAAAAQRLPFGSFHR